MDTPTKQRLVGAAVLIALAVIFLPMLVKGPAPDSGVSDVPLDMPRQPDGAIETRDLPLVGPQPGEGGALGPQPVPDQPGQPGQPEGDRLPTVDTGASGAASAQPDPDAADLADTQMQPASVAGGDYAVHFGAYGTSGDAATIVGQLRAANLPGYSEPATLNGRQAWRVRIGPFATRADAESARLRATTVRSDVGARVVVLDAAGASASTPAAARPVETPARSEPLPPVQKPAAPPVAAAPRPAEPAKPTPAPATPAASGTGFAVQVGAFGNAAEATRLRDRLRAAGFTAFTETVSGDKGPLTRVRVGPVLTRGEAERLRAQVSAKAGVSGMVRSHP